ncbi:MAG: bifunctional aspartate kinase/homoserine dehydrogenase I [Bacteroidaceae bacterium]|nr:bifunctional aspartate kinase/homoserine dehydrogenase I [Bacteroidaceae bacterium]
MKVMKFGGTSVGSVNSILNLKAIVEKAALEENVIVVVSALGGITDKLIRTANMAVGGDTAFNKEFQEIVTRHHELVNAIINDESKRTALLQEVDMLLNELNNIYQGLALINNLAPKSEATIVSYGERISSRITAALIEGSVRYNSRNFIRTEFKHGKYILASEETDRLIHKHFDGSNDRIIVVPGFIAQDNESGDITNLGRGGSDYTAAILAATLNAECLEIWTDVDGFMTADPRVINNAYTIGHLSYVEATELCNFGAKVVYPPTIYPVFKANIPIRVKNTFNPDGEGTVIDAHSEDEGRLIKGISSINDTDLLTVQGLGMVGVVGVNHRIFRALANADISVFLVAQASSENSTSLGLRHDDSAKACEVLNKEFEKEISMGLMESVRATGGLSTVAIVGENMRHNAGIIGKLFQTLGRNGINVISCAQGGQETNISFVIEAEFLRKTLNVIHDSFFLSEYKVLNLFICGIGTVGSSLIEQIASQQEKLKKEHGLKLNVVGIANSRHAIFDREGLDLANYRTSLMESKESDISNLRDEIVKMNIFNSVFVDCTANEKVASIYGDLLSRNVSVVAANKIAASGDYATYCELKHIARQRNIKYLFETNVGAGLPIINTINDLINSGDKILKIEAVLSGTLNFIFNVLSSDIPLSEAVRLAQEKGYSEPDPRIDLSGKDVIRKLVILAREAGYAIEQSEVEANLFIPQELFDGTLENFWAKLPQLDAQFENDRKQLANEKKHWRFIAKYENGKGSVSLCKVNERHPFYHLEGSNNIILLTTERYKEYPMLIQGYGAGASVTAAGVFADIMRIANI